VSAAVADVLGASGVFFDPLWRIEVALTPLEGRLLRTRWVRRLAFVSHAGASSIATTQSYSRLEHSLGLLALVAHFAPEDRAARIAALLHDIGHLPFSHTFEGLAGLDHHQLGADRIRDLAPLLQAHGVDGDEVLAIDRGDRASVLHNPNGALRLDHLESFVRSGRSHGRTTEPPPATLDRLRVTGGAVDTDEATAAYISDLVAAEARSHLSEINVITNAVLRHLAATVLGKATPAGVLHLAQLADDQFWAVLLTDPDVRDSAQRLRDDPLHWRAERLGADEVRTGGGLQHTVRRLYLDLPLIDGIPARRSPPDLPALPVRYQVAPADETAR
jgi:hypothetical protein